MSWREPQSIRWKLTLFTLAPVVAVFAFLLAIGVADTREQLAHEAQRWLSSHAKQQSAQLALELGRVPLLAQGLGDLMSANPEQPQTLLYAHLIDGLRRTPLAERATVRFDRPARSAVLQRGESIGRPARPGDPAADLPARGWHRAGDRLVFVRPIVVRGEVHGSVSVETRVADVYAALASGGREETRLFLGDARGIVPPPGPAAGLIELLDRPGITPDAGVGTVHDASGEAQWVARAALPGLPLTITAATPAAAALAPARRQAARVAAVLLASLAGIVLVVGLVARRLTAPLQRLDAAVERIRQGRFDVAPDIRGSDELSRLANAVKRLAGELEAREAQLRRTQQALERRVAERTRALRQSNARLKAQYEELRHTEHALRVASQQAEHASKAKSEFLSHMSHELRTPLHGILGYAQLLRRDGGGDPAQRQSLLAIERCGQHLLTLINQILELTRIEAGQLAVNNRPVDLGRLLEDVELIIAERAQAKGLAFSVVRAGALPETVLTDPVKLRQILLNLVSNAVKFTSAGRVTLSVGRNGDGRLEFVVEDTGIGIPEEQLQRIFDPFHRFADRPSVEGTGLGLTINNKLIGLLGGRPLDVESSPGRGSRFRFCLPAPAVPAAAPSPRPVAPAPSPGRRDAALDPQAAWPAALAATTATRLRAAADLGDIGGLQQLADELAAAPGTPAGAARHIAGLAEAFDFDALRSLAAALEDRTSGCPDRA